MKKILITRPADVAQKMADKLNEKGLPAVLDPMLIPVRTENVVFLDRHAEDGFVFTSPRAVKYFCDLSAHIDFSLPAYCVGPKTAQQAKACGFKTITTGPGNSKGLADVIINDCNDGARLMHPCGEHVEDEFYETLKEAGLILAPLTVYTMDMAPRMQEDALVSIRTDDILGVVFFSKRTAKSFVELAEQHKITDHIKNMTAICISEDVAGILDASKWNDIKVSASKTEDSLIESCIELKGK